MLLLLVGLALAEVPLPSWRDELAVQRWHEVDALLTAGQAEEAIAAVRRFEARVTPDARLAYLEGLAHRQLGDNRAAERAYVRSVDMDPARQDAWYDLGELYLVQGRYDEADVAFGHVEELVDRGDRAWLGPWRRAEVAGWRRDPDAFEAHLREALRRGFTFREIEGRDNWRAFYADPVLRDSIRKLVTVYGDDSTLDSLEAP